MTIGDCNVATALISTGGALVGALIGSFTGYLTARQQFRSTVVSTSRQAWIASLRDSLADYQVSIATLGTMFVIPPRDEAARQQVYARAGALSYKIKLLLNPDEARHVELINAVDAAFNALEPAFKTGDHSQAVAQVRKVTELGQRILKAEWQRVKAGD